MHGAFTGLGQGAILALLAALCTYVITYFPKWRKETRETQITQMLLMTKVQNALWPENERSLVKTVESLSTLLDSLSKEIEEDNAVTKKDIEKLKHNIQEIKEFLEFNGVERRQNRLNRKRQK